MYQLYYHAVSTALSINSRTITSFVLSYYNTLSVIPSHQSYTMPYESAFPLSFMIKTWIQSNNRGSWNSPNTDPWVALCVALKTFNTDQYCTVMSSCSHGNNLLCASHLCHFPCSPCNCSLTQCSQSRILHKTASLLTIPIYLNYRDHLNKRVSYRGNAFLLVYGFALDSHTQSSWNGFISFHCK